MRPGLALYQDYRFAEAMAYFETRRKSRKLPDALFIGMSGLMTGGLALPFAGYFLKTTYDPLFRAMGHCHYQLKNDKDAVHFLRKIYSKSAADLAVMSVSLGSLGHEAQAQAVRQMALAKDPRVADWIADCR